MRRMQVMIRAAVAAFALAAIALAWPTAQAVQSTDAQAGQTATQAPTKPTAALPASMAELKPIEADDRMLLAPPTIDIKPEGLVDVTFETAVPTPAGRVYVGVLSPSSASDALMFPMAVREALQEPSTSHRFSFDARRIESWWPPADAGGSREGDAYVRIELYDSRTGGARYFETSVHIANVQGQFEKRATVLLGPVVDQVTTTSALISWNTDVRASGKVELYAADTDRVIGSFATNGEPADHPIVKITGLKAGGSYRYRVLVTDPAAGRVVNSGRVYPFRAANGPASEFKFIYMSDGRPSVGGGFINFNGVNAAVTPRLMADGYRRGGAFAMFAGDLTSGYTSSVENFRMMLDTWKHVNDPVAHSMPIYEGFGNHESLHRMYSDALGNRYSTDRLGDTSSEAEFGSRFVNPENAPDPELQNGVAGPPYKGTVYSFDYGNSHFVMLNSDYWFTNGGPAGDRGLAWKLLGGNREGYLMANQLAWLERDLAAARKRGVTHIFVAGHEPVLPVGGHVGDAMWWRGLNDPSLPSGDVLAMRTKFLSILSRYGVATLLAGHEHVYARLSIDSTIDKQVTRPITQFVSGGAGAPFYAQDQAAPWAKAVKKFAAVNHYMLFTVAATGVRFEAIDIDGHVFDSGVIK